MTPTVRYFQRLHRAHLEVAMCKREIAPDRRRYWQRVFAMGRGMARTLAQVEQSFALSDLLPFRTLPR